MQDLASILPYQPKRVRRPLLAVMYLLQKRHGEQLGDKVSESSSEVGNKLGTKVTNPKSSDESADTVASQGGNESSKVEVDNCAERNSEGSQTNDTVDLEVPESTSKVDISKKPQPVSKVYSLLDTLMKAHPDLNDGFSYAYKYTVPKASSKLDEVEVSVQQSLKRFPEIPEEPLQHQHFKAPIDYKKVQENLDSLLEESNKSGEPLHLNTPGAFGPLLLSHHLEKSPVAKKDSPSDPSEGLVLETPEEHQEINSEQSTKLMLRPVAKAVAGPKGIAIASPIAKAVLRRGQKVTLDYDPDAVAIAGPGGRAHAHPEFSVDYLDSKESEK